MIRLIIKNPERVALVGKGIGSATAEQVGDAMESIARIQWAQMGRGFIGDGLRIGHLDVGVQRLVRLKMGFPKLKKENVENYEKMLRVPISWDWEIVKGINNRKKRFTDRVIRDQPWWGDCHWWTED
ncbi:Protein of unknown function [Pyronema omphalodes CBS 100304]|uniref:Uncharacterized protein n=1 Tax=Pyronema omphalodes (strain CBS 100304) TaxID=1076935 RepID=U4LGB4_PYROM|nr:Protein of unknown function [Pyronema omphalodes CBS 100304]